MNDKNLILKEKYLGEETSEYLKDLKRLKSGEPVGYIIGYVPFINCHIDVSERPLLPRTETEFWVNEIIKTLKKNKRKEIKILDLFSGSGCIGVALLENLQNINVDFGEKNIKSLKQIKKNIKINKIDNLRCKIIHTDVFKNIRNTYDYIFANPPYLSKNRTDKIQKSVLDFEPHEALFAKDDGMFFINKLLKESGKYLKKEGVLFIEHDLWQVEHIKKQAKKFKWKADFLKDQYDKLRTAMLTKT